MHIKASSENSLRLLALTYIRAEFDFSFLLVFSFLFFKTFLVVTYLPDESNMAPTISIYKTIRVFDIRIVSIFGFLIAVLYKNRISFFQTWLVMNSCPYLFFFVFLQKSNEIYRKKIRSVYLLDRISKYQFLQDSFHDIVKSCFEIYNKCGPLSVCKTQSHWTMWRTIFIVWISFVSLPSTVKKNKIYYLFIPRNDYKTCNLISIKRVVKKYSLLYLFIHKMP